MSNIRELKNRIKSVRDTGKITNAMYLIFSTRLGSSREKLVSFLPYSEQIKSEMACIKSTDFEKKDIVPDGKTVIFMFGSEKGLNGDYGKNIAKEYLAMDSSDKRLIVYGANTQKYLDLHKAEYIKYESKINRTDVKSAKELISYLMKQYEADDVNEVKLMYTDYSGKKNHIVCEKLFPISAEISYQEDEMEFYPDERTVSKKIFVRCAEAMIYRAMLESYCSEQNAGMLAMDAANTNASELLDNLNLRYNHLRQNEITEEITEISAATKRGKKI